MTPPVIKWVGGKTRLLPELARRMPTTFGHYFEPFAGGAALFFDRAPERASISDQNADLVNLYQRLRDDVDGVIRRLRVHRKAHGKRYYYRLRDRWNDEADLWKSVDRAAAFIYLNKTCFNGLWRVNKSGEFNVPMGRYDDPQIFVPKNLRMAAAQLSRASIRCCGYDAAVAEAVRGDFVYLDPPYDPINATSSFTKYGADGFTRVDQTALAELAQTLVDRGCYVMLSNNDTRFVRRLYNGWKIDRVQCSRALNSNIKKRGSIGELIIRGGYST